MRLALLGKIGEYDDVVETVSRFCLATLNASRVIYLGGDDTLDRSVSAWATRIAGTSTLQPFWQRTLTCLSEDGPGIEQFVTLERTLQTLRRLETLTPEPCGGLLIAVGPCDVRLGTDLETCCPEDGDDVVRVDGSRAEPQLEQALVGPVVLAPGDFGHAGVMLLESLPGELRVRLFNRHCEELGSCRVPMRPCPSLRHPT